MSNPDFDPSLLGGSSVGTFKRPTFKLVLPNNAGPNDPRVEIGNVIPAELTAFYAGLATGAETTIFGILYYGDATHYTYNILVTIANSTVVKNVIGTRNPAGISEAMAIVPTVAAQGSIISIGEQTTVQMEFWKSFAMFFFNSSQLLLKNTSAIVAGDTSTIELQGTSQFLMFTGTTMVAESGSSVQFQSGNQFIMGSAEEVTNTGTVTEDAGSVHTFNGLTKFNPSNAAITNQGDHDVLFDNNISAHRGLKSISANATGTIATVSSTAEVDTFMGVSVAFKNTRRYLGRIRFFYQSATLQGFSLRAHLTTIGGTTIAFFGVFWVPFANVAFIAVSDIEMRNDSGADITRTIFITMNLLSGTASLSIVTPTTLGTNFCIFDVQDYGSSAENALAFAVT